VTDRRAVLGTACIEEHHPVVYDSFVLDKRDDYVAYATFKLGSLDDAREVVNEAFFKLYLRWDEALASENTAAYGWKILHDGIVDVLRKRDRRPSTPAGVAFEPSAHPVTGIPDEEIDRVSLRMQVNEAVDKLPDRQRTCVTLHFLLGVPVKEVASLIGLSRSTVRSHLAVAMNQLAIELTESDPPPAAHEKGHHG
jgi:RNA polymerase sigma factor (sigma-70 family)